MWTNLAGDFLKWLTHRMQHAIPVLWRLHRLHHSTQELDSLRVNYFFATQEFHHWHHADDPQAIDKNFGGFLSVWDWIFGTAYCPQNGTIHRFGLSNTKSPRTYADHVRLRF